VPWRVNHACVLDCVQHATAVRYYIYTYVPRPRASAHQHRVPVLRIAVDLVPAVIVASRYRSHYASRVCDVDVKRHNLAPILLALYRAKSVPTIGLAKNPRTSDISSCPVPLHPEIMRQELIQIKGTKKH